MNDPITTTAETETTAPETSGETTSPETATRPKRDRSRKAPPVRPLAEETPTTPVAEAKPRGGKTATRKRGPYKKRGEAAAPDAPATPARRGRKPANAAGAPNPYDRLMKRVHEAWAGKVTVSCNGHGFVAHAYPERNRVNDIVRERMIREGKSAVDLNAVTQMIAEEQDRPVAMGQGNTIAEALEVLLFIKERQPRG